VFSGHGGSGIDKETKLQIAKLIRLPVPAVLRLRVQLLIDRLASENRRQFLRRARLILVATIEGESGLEHDLVAADRAIHNTATRLNDLKPSQIPESSIRTLDCGLNCVLNTVVGRPNQFHDLINVICH
jgi:hypothetical protein